MWEVGEDGRRYPTEAQFILKWGGELTHLGQTQAHNLGTRRPQSVLGDVYSLSVEQQVTYARS